MGIELFWDNDEQTVFLVQFKGSWTWDELNDVIYTTQKISTQRGQVIGALLNLSDGLTIPGGTVFSSSGMSQFRELLRMSNNGKTKGPVVIVGMPAMLRSIFDTVKIIERDATQDIYFSDTMSQGRAIMQQRLRELGINA